MCVCARVDVNFRFEIGQQNDFMIGTALIAVNHIGELTTTILHTRIFLLMISTTQNDDDGDVDGDGDDDDDKLRQISLYF